MVLACLCLCGCSPGEEPESLSNGRTLPPDFRADRLPALEDYLADEELPSGEWREENGARVCDGYLTRFADQDFCAAEVPEDWVPFEFDGQQFYLQPLSERQN